MREVTNKMVIITACFSLTTAPFCISMISVTIELPKSTQLLDMLIVLALFNSMVQPMLTICIMTNIREALARIIMCKPSKKISMARDRSMHQSRGENRRSWRPSEMVSDKVSNSESEM